MQIHIKTLLLYITAFESIASGKALHIPKTITAKYVQFAEEIVSTSYTQSEKFSPVSDFTLNI